VRHDQVMVGGANGCPSARASSASMPIPRSPSTSPSASGPACRSSLPPTTSAPASTRWRHRSRRARRSAPAAPGCSRSCPATPGGATGPVRRASSRWRSATTPAMRDATRTWASRRSASPASSPTTVRSSRRSSVASRWADPLRIAHQHGIHNAASPKEIAADLVHREAMASIAAGAMRSS
jgi:hypothetical protein